VENTPKCRLINPAKSESEMLSIIILDKIKNFERTQWRITQKELDSLAT
jgi:hypothetical protein